MKPVALPVHHGSLHGNHHHGAHSISVFGGGNAPQHHAPPMILLEADTAAGGNVQTLNNGRSLPKAPPSSRMVSWAKRRLSSTRLNSAQKKAVMMNGGYHTEGVV